MTSKYFLLILLFSLLISCGKLNIQDSCNCELEKSTLAEMESELIELKKDMEDTAVNNSNKGKEND